MKLKHITFTGMESGVCTDDWFDVDKVRKVLEICSSVLIDVDCL